MNYLTRIAIYSIIGILFFTTNGFISSGNFSYEILILCILFSINLIIIFTIFKNTSICYKILPVIIFLASEIILLEYLFLVIIVPLYVDRYNFAP